MYVDIVQFTVKFSSKQPFCKNLPNNNTSKAILSITHKHGSPEIGVASDLISQKEKEKVKWPLNST